MKTVKMLTILVLRSELLRRVALVLGLLVCQVNVSEAVPMGTAFTYQGRLFDANDPADGEYDFQFRLFDAPNGGVQQGSTIDINDVDVIDGYFTVELDFGSSVFGGDARWLQIGVRQVANPFTILSPRQEVTPTPYALYAASGPGAPVPLELSGSVVYPGAVIKGTNTGTGRAVYGIHNSSGNFGYLGHSDRGVYGYSINDYGVRGHGGSYGVYGSSSDGYGVYGKHYSGNYGFLGSDLFGVYGKHETSGNYGYLGYSNRGACGISSDGYGVYGQSISDTGVYGVSSTGTGVYGKHNMSGDYGYLGSSNRGVYGFSTDGYGVHGQSIRDTGVYGSSSTGTAVYGIHDSSANKGFLGSSDYGVYGSSSGSSYSVYGEHTSSGNIGYLGGDDIGVYGSSTSGYAVYGWSYSGHGVDGFSTGGHGVDGSSYNGHGVHGSSNNGYAGYFTGNVYVTNDVSALSFTDRTPYPKDLATAYQAVMSMERLPDTQYDENNKQEQMDHSKLSDFVRSKDGNRDLSATVSCHNEVLKHLIRKNDELEEAYIHIEQLNKRIIALEAKLVKMEGIVGNLQ